MNCGRNFVLTSLLLVVWISDVFSNDEPVAVSACSIKRCRTACGPSGYTKDENGCSTCTCQLKSEVQCSRAMCRMFCPNGFKRDENGCEYCACNECPRLECPNTCDKYEKDSKGCSTCQCESESQCPAMKCDLTCPNGFERDENGCTLCSCSQCSLNQCRMFCMYGFRRNERGCEICECDWTPIRENIPCSDKIPCSGSRVCNMQLKLCETVESDRVNWFVYNFEVQNELLTDRQIIETFKNGLIHNIATKYGLQVTQIAVSNVSPNGEASFQIMPFFDEDLDQFEKKMDQIDLDLNTHEFRAALPAIIRATEDDQQKPSVVDQWKETWIRYTSGRRRFFTYTIFFILTSITVLLAILLINMLRRPVNYSNLSDSKSPIYDTPYHKAPTDEEHFPAVQAPDGTTYVIVPADETGTDNDKRAVV